MILFHGSYAPIEKPDIKLSRRFLDFGIGFYTTPYREQAVHWAKHFIDTGRRGFVSHYAFLQRPIDDVLPKTTKILEFNTHSLKWLDFITTNRLGRHVEEQWDLIMGGVANDKVFDALQLYFDGIIPAREAIRRLRYNKPNFQYCFKNQWLIDNYLHFIEAEEIL
jgi:hypothetical protein